LVDQRADNAEQPRNAVDAGGISDTGILEVEALTTGPTVRQHSAMYEVDHASMF
jgi:hypothetical protein